MTYSTDCIPCKEETHFKLIVNNELENFLLHIKYRILLFNYNNHRNLLRSLNLILYKNE